MSCCAPSGALLNLLIIFYLPFMGRVGPALGRALEIVAKGGRKKTDCMRLPTSQKTDFNEI
jgi:hypothetical protein